MTLYLSYVLCIEFFFLLQEDSLHKKKYQFFLIVLYIDQLFSHPEDDGVLKSFLFWKKSIGNEFHCSC